MSFQPDPFANNSPDPFAPTPTDGFEGSYTLATASDNRQYKPTVTGLGMFFAPWPLLLAALCYIGIAGVFIYRMVAHIHAGNNLNDVLFLVAVVAIVLLVGFSVVSLKAKEWGRIALSVMSGLGVFVVVAPGLWPVTLIGIAAAVLLWLPGNKHWFGY